MALEFVVPVHTADIELERADRFFVQELHDVEGLAPSSQEELLDVVDACTTHGADAAAARTAYKMASFLCHMLVEKAEKYDAATSAMAESAAKAKASKSKSKKLALDAEAELEFNWAVEAVGLVDVFAALCSMKLSKFWSMGIPEEELLNMQLKTSFLLLQNNNITKQKAPKLGLCRCVAVIVSKYPVVVPSAVTSMMHYLNGHEHAVGVLAEILRQSSADHNASYVTAELLREIGKVSGSDVKDTSGMRNMAAFLVELSQRLPNTMRQHVSVLLPHLDAEAYGLRSAVVTALGHIVGRWTPGSGPALDQDENDEKDKADTETDDEAVDAEDSDADEEPNGEADADSHAAAAASGEDGKTGTRGEDHLRREVNARHALLDVIQDRTLDVNAFVRAAALRSLSAMVDDRTMPPERTHIATQIAAQRMSDKSVNVRKSAIHLLGTLLDNNPFGGQLRSGPYEARAAAIEAHVRSLNNRLILKEFGLRYIAPKPDEKNGEEATAAAQDAEAQAQAQAQAEAEAEAELAASMDQNIDELMTPQLQQMVAERGLCLGAAAFIQQLKRSLPRVCDLMNSSSTQDAREAMRFITRARMFDVEGAQEAVRELLTMIWSNDQALREEVMTSFAQLFLVAGESGNAGGAGAEDEDMDGDFDAHNPAIIAANLIDLALGASLGVKASLEEVLSLVIHQNKLPNAVVRYLWAFVDKAVSHIAEDASVQRKQLVKARGALAVLSMVASAKASFCLGPLGLTILQKVTALPKEGGVGDFRLMKHACTTLRKMAVGKVQDTAAVALELGASKKSSIASLCSAIRVKGSKAAAVSKIVANLVEAMSGGMDGGVTHDAYWFPACEQAINVVYRVCVRPDLIMDTVVQRLVATIQKQSSAGAAVGLRDSLATAGGQTVLARLFFVLGHTAIGSLVYMETISRDAKKLRHKAEEAHAKSAEARTAAGREAIEDELGVAAAAEDKEAELFAKLSEKHLVIGKSLLATFGPLVQSVVMSEYSAATSSSTNTATSGSDSAASTESTTGLEVDASSTPLAQSALLALCKFMAISPQFCEANLQLLFSVLEYAPLPELRATIAVSLGDLAFRFPNLLEPWNARLFSRLGDRNSCVRRNTLMVLSHLILNDMVKIKGQVADIALCVEDQNVKIRDLSRMFFHELSKRGHNPIYNLLPDTLSCLSNNAAISPVTFRAVMKHLLQYITKDKQAESLMDKLLQRFGTTDDVTLHRNMAYCLAQLPLSEKGLKKLHEGLRLYRTVLGDETVYQHFVAIAAKGKKLSKPEAKAMAEEWEVVLEKCATDQLGEDEIVARTSGRGKTAAKRATASKRSKGGGGGGGEESAVLPPRAPSTRRKAAASKQKYAAESETSEEEEESDIEEFSDVEEDDDAENDAAEATTAGKARKQSAVAKRGSGTASSLLSLSNR